MQSASQRNSSDTQGSESGKNTTDSTSLLSSTAPNVLNLYPVDPCASGYVPPYVPIGKKPRSKKGRRADDYAEEHVAAKCKEWVEKYGATSKGERKRQPPLFIYLNAELSTEACFLSPMGQRSDTSQSENSRFSSDHQPSISSRKVAPSGVYPRDSISPLEELSEPNSEDVSLAVVPLVQKKPVRNPEKKSKILDEYSDDGRGEQVEEKKSLLAGARKRKREAGPSVVHTQKTMLEHGRCRFSTGQVTTGEKEHVLPKSRNSGPSATHVVSNEVAEAQINLAALLAKDFTRTMTDENLAELKNLLFVIEINDSHVSVDQLLRLHMMKSIPLLAQRFQETNQKMQYDSCCANLSLNIAEIISQSRCYSQCRDEAAQMETEIQSCVEEKKWVDEGIADLMAERRQVVGNLKRKIAARDKLISERRGAANLIPGLVKMIEEGSSKRHELEIRKADTVNQMNEIITRYAS